MARVTIEDCLKNVDNRFELILVASRRARQLALGRIEPTVLALREIAEGSVTRAILDEPDENFIKREPPSFEMILMGNHGF